MYMSFRWISVSTLSIHGFSDDWFPVCKMGGRNDATIDFSLQDIAHDVQKKPNTGVNDGFVP